MIAIVAVPLRSQEDIPKDFICAVCLSIALDPWVVGRCNHIFCKTCLQQCIQSSGRCPVCRGDCSNSTDSAVGPLSEINPLAHRIWSGISVKCQYHADGCCWNGSISDYETHARVCASRNPRPNERSALHLKEEITQLRESIEEKDRYIKDLEEELDEKDREIRDLEEESDEKDIEHDDMYKRIEEYKSSLMSLENKFFSTIETLWNNERGGHVYDYDYDSDSVVELTKLICQNIEDKPYNIDEHKVFECVQKITSDLRMKWIDNPEHFHLDVRMLVGFCLASNWFTDNQRQQIQQWADEHGRAFRG